MNRKAKSLSLILAAPLLAGCATMAKEPKAVSHEYVAPSRAGNHLAIQISMWTGVPNTPQQTVMLVYSPHSKSPIVVVEGQTKTMSEELTAQFLSIFGGIATGASAAAISGNYVLQAAQADCPQDSVCGTLVQVQNQAGASAGAEAEANSN